MNIPMLRNQPASRMLRLHRVLSIQISVIYIELTYWLNVGCWRSSVLSYVKACVYLVFSPYVEQSILEKIYLLPDSNWRSANNFSDSVLVFNNLPCILFWLHINVYTQSFNTVGCLLFFCKCNFSHYCL